MIEINELENARRHMNRIGIALIFVILLQLTVPFAIFYAIALTKGVHIGFYGFAPAQIAKTIAEIKAAVPGSYAAKALALLLTTLISDLVPFSFCAKSVDIDVRRIFSRPKISAGMVAIIGVVAFGASIAASIFIRIISLLLKFMGVLLSTPSFNIKWSSPFAAAVMIIAIVIAAPLAEEFIFRGVLLTVFRRFGNIFAIIASSLAWALLHGNFIQAVPVFAMGLFLGIIAVKADSIVPTLIIHMANNAVSVIATAITGQKSIAVGLVLVFINLSLITLAVIFAAVYYKKIFNISGGENKESSVNLQFGGSLHCGGTAQGFKMFFTSVPVLIAVLICIFFLVRSIHLI